VGEGEVHVVAAEHQVIADADARQHRLAVAQRDLDQRQVGGAAADVADEQQARLCEFVGEPLLMPEEPVVEGRLRFLEQAQVRQPGLPRCRQRQGAGAFVEGGGNGQDQLLPLQRRLRKTVQPGGTHMREIAGAGADRRHLVHRVVGAPGQDRRQTIDRRVRQPALGARHQPTGNLAAEIERQATGDHWRRALLHRPRQLQLAGIDLAGGRMVAHRRQQRSRRDLAGSDELFDLEQFDLLPAGRGVGDDGIAGAEIDADNVLFVHVPRSVPARWRRRAALPGACRRRGAGAWRCLLQPLPFYR
jgi:hypothetical protein